MTTPAVFRPRAALTEELEALSPQAESGSRFHGGARDALRWLLVGGPGPLTGSVSEPPLRQRAIVAELAAAEARLYGSKSADRDYAAGLEHAVMWALSATPATPSAAQLRPAAPTAAP